MGDEELGKTRGQTAAAATDKADESPEKPKISRDSTMQVTAQVNSFSSSSSPSVILLVATPVPMMLVGVSVHVEILIQ